MLLMRENIEELPGFVLLAKDIGAHGVYVEQLLPPTTPIEQWVVRRDDFEFRYADQRLSEYPDLNDKYVMQALDLADELDIKLAGPELFYKQDQAAANQRPCRVLAYGL
jgi:hypothetical protein